MSTIGHFGGHAAEYVKYRPTYPEALYQSLLTQLEERELAWDCGTGNGQVALRLAESFQSVHATDINSRQLEVAPKNERVNYACSPAHQTELESDSVDLITVASAVHWFDIDSFYREAQRVLKPGGVLAVWTYAPDLLGPSALGQVVRGFAEDTFRQDWPEGIGWVDRRYEDLPFPFQEIPLTKIAFPLLWSMDNLVGWISTWSAYNRHLARTGVDLRDFVEARLAEVWPEPKEKAVELDFPLYARVGRALSA